MKFSTWSSTQLPLWAPLIPSTWSARGSLGDFYENHQRYFVVRDKAGKLLPNFISVRNGNDQYIDNVIKGNEKFWWLVWKTVSSSGVRTKTQDCRLGRTPQSRDLP